MANLQVKISRPLFILLEVVVNAGTYYLAPLIPNIAIQGFAVAVLNGVMVYLVTETPKDTPPSTSTV